MSNRAELAEKLELIGEMFEIDGMTELLKKFSPKEDEKGNKIPITQVQFNAVVIQIESLLLREAKETADKIIAMSGEISLEQVEALDDADYANALKAAIITDVMGFFGSSPRTDGKK